MRKINIQKYIDIPFDDREILHYLEQQNAIPELDELLSICKDKVREVIDPKLCWCELNLDDINLFLSMAKNTAFEEYFNNCERGILFAVTLGFDFDRLLRREEISSMTAALLIQAIGTQQVEEMCDSFCKDMQSKYRNCKARFSPGYGGLDLSVQKKVFEFLDCQRSIGISLNESLLMSPIKSVTAFIAIE